MAEVIARVIAENGKPEGGLVELSNGETNLTGRVAAVSENEFLVNWEDGARSVENQSDYELVVTAAPKVPSGFVTDEPIELGEHVTSEEFPVVNRKARTAQENPAQPAGWAVPPMDANAYPGGELMMIEQEKRGETAQWEDAQNRPPVDAENPAQPAGFAVPSATGGPIPGQGADGLMMAARVIAEDITGENGLVELTNGNLRVAGKILAADDETFIVEWEDERRTVESKADYDLIISEASTKEGAHQNPDGTWEYPLLDAVADAHRTLSESEDRRMKAQEGLAEMVRGTKEMCDCDRDPSCGSCGGSGLRPVQQLSE